MQKEKQMAHEIEGSSDRNFGLTVGGVLILIEAYRFLSNGDLDTLGIVLICISIPLVLFGFVYPSILAPLNKTWTKLGLLMYKIVNPVIMFAIYVLSIVPIGLILRLSGKDLLSLKLDESAISYWIKRDPVGPSPDSMKNQF